MAIREHASPVAPSPRNRRRACSLRSQGRLPTSLSGETLDAGGMLRAAFDEGCAGTGPAISQVHCSALEYVGDAPGLNEAAMLARGCHPAYASRIQPRTADPTPDLPELRSTGTWRSTSPPPSPASPTGFGSLRRQIRAGSCGGCSSYSSTGRPSSRSTRPAKLLHHTSPTGSGAPRWTGQQWGEPPDDPSLSPPPPAAPRAPETTASPRNPHADRPAATRRPGGLRAARRGSRSPCSPARRPGSPLGHHPSNS
jgi:hypothetical protein